MEQKIFKNKKKYRLTLTLRQAATVFVLSDVRNEPPEWLAEQFQATGDFLRVGPWHQALETAPGIELEADGPYLRFAVWKTNANPGELHLGHPGESMVGEQAVMYGVAVKSQF